MKKLISLIALVAGLTFTATAQDSNDDNKVRFGLKGGFNISNVYDVEGGDYEADAKLGLVAGVFLAIPMGQSFGFQPELLFSQKGFRGTGVALGTNYDFSRTTSYFDIPLLLVFKPGPKVSILAGPQISYLLSQTDRVKSGDFTAVHEQTFNNDNPRKNTVGFTGGLDFHMSSVVLGTRLGWDFTKNNGDGSQSALTYKNVWLQATLGFML